MDIKRKFLKDINFASTLSISINYYVANYIMLSITQIYNRIRNAIRGEKLLKGSDN